MSNWIKENFSWLKWILGAIWSAIIFWVGNYISYIKMRADVDAIMKTNETIIEQLTIIISKL